MSTPIQNPKSGKGLIDGVISELAAFFGVLPGHEDEARSAVGRFAQTIREFDPRLTVSTGLRDSRHVIFDEGTRLLWLTTFESDWNPYLDDALLIVGADSFIDWMRHTTEASTILGWYEQYGGAEGFQPDSPGFRQRALQAGGDLKKIIQSVQTPAAAYFNSLSAVTMPQVTRGQQLEAAFQQALADPASKPLVDVLKPVLDRAAE